MGAEAAGHVLWTLVTALPLCGWAMLAAGLSPSAVALVGAVLVSAGVARRLTERWVWVTLSASGALALSALVCGWFYDVSWDGQAYHQEAVLRIAGGWNPLWDPPLDLQRRPDDLWVNCYPQGAWIAAAVLFRATRHLEAAKALQLFAVAPALMLSYAALRGFGMRRWPAWGLSALAALNPVAICQSLTFYVDGLLASALTVLAALTALWWQRPRRGLLLAIGATLIFASNLKFTGLIYAGLYAAALSAFVLARRRAHVRPVIVALGAALAVAVLVVGYSPYVHNVRRHHHPFYPLVGSLPAQVLSFSVPKELLAAGPFTALTRTLFSRLSITTDPPEWKVPFSVRASELEGFAVPDVLIAGFGPLFGGALLLALLSLGGAFFRRTPGAGPAAVVCAALLASVLMNPAPSVARYVPQLWLVPLLMLIVARPRGLGTLAGAVLALNVLLVTGAFVRGQMTSSRQVRDQLAWLAASKPGAVVELRFDGFEPNRQRFTEAGLPFVERNPLSCAVPLRLLHTKATICPPVGP